MSAINIPGITVTVTEIDLEDSTDVAHTIIITDQGGRVVMINIAFGKIIDIR